MFRYHSLATRVSIRAPRVSARAPTALFSSVTDPAASLLKLSDFPVADLKGKTVFLRADFNVKYSPLPSSGTTGPDAVPAYEVNKSSFKRIDETVPTLRHLLDAGARVVVTAHLGDPKPEDLATPASRAKVSLRPVLTALESALGSKGAFAEDCIGPAAAAGAAAVPKEGGYVLLENLRFHKGEKKNDPAFVQALLDATKPDVYVNDAFGTAHRKHASVVGLPTAFAGPCAAGLLMSREVVSLYSALPPAPAPGTIASAPAASAAVLGGVKVDSKLPVFLHLVERVDELVVGGAMALPFLMAQGKLPAGTPLPEGVDADSSVALAQSVLDKAQQRGVAVVLPTDFVTLKENADPKESGELPVVMTLQQIADKVKANEPVSCLDIGPSTAESFAAALAPCSSVVWNGPMGRLEWAGLQKGTTAIARVLSSLPHATTVAGGGETAMGVSMAQDEARADGIAAAAAAGADADAIAAAGEDAAAAVQLTHVSTGGGASLEILKGEVLPAVAALDTVA